MSAKEDLQTSAQPDQVNGTDPQEAMSHAFTEFTKACVRSMTDPAGNFAFDPVSLTIQQRLMHMHLQALLDTLVSVGMNPNHVLQRFLHSVHEATEELNKPQIALAVGGNIRTS